MAEFILSEAEGLTQVVFPKGHRWRGTSQNTVILEKQLEIWVTTAIRSDDPSERERVITELLASLSPSCRSQGE